MVADGDNVAREVGGRADAEAQRSAVAVEADLAFAPAVSVAHELADGEAVEEFIGEDDGGAGRHGVEIVVVLDAIGAETVGLRAAKCGAGFDEGDVGGVEKAGHGRGRP